MRSKNGIKDKIRLTVPAKANYLASIRQLALDVAHSTSLSEDEIKDFSLAVMEASTNAVMHSKSDLVTTIFSVDGDCLIARIIDRGRGFKMQKPRNSFPPSNRQGGRGIPLMNNLVDLLKIKSQNGSTEVTLVKWLNHNRVSGQEVRNQERRLKVSN
ncbi:MAG: ATP-binding protein [Firmicutes bacterium]|nr:ATP-binding protein [Bacillota bacterium]